MICGSPRAKTIKKFKIKYPSQILQADLCNFYILFTRTKTYGIDN
jgi:hypothetical protein